MADIFISYKRDADFSNAEKLVRALETQEQTSRRLTVCWDQKLHAGTRYTDKIFSELREARCVLALWSEATPSSVWVGMGEALEALGRGTLITVLLDDEADVPEIYRTEHVLSLSDGDGQVSHPKFVELLSSIDHKLTGPSSRAGWLVQFLVWLGRSKRAGQKLLVTLNTITDFIARLIRGNERFLWLRALLTGFIIFGAGAISIDLSHSLFIPIWTSGFWITCKVWKRRPSSAKQPAHDSSTINQKNIKP